MGELEEPRAVEVDRVRIELLGVRRDAGEEEPGAVGRPRDRLPVARGPPKPRENSPLVGAISAHGPYTRLAGSEILTDETDSRAIRGPAERDRAAVLEHVPALEDVHRVGPVGSSYQDPNPPLPCLVRRVGDPGPVRRPLWKDGEARALMKGGDPAGAGIDGKQVARVLLVQGLGQPHGGDPAARSDVRARCGGSRTQRKELPRDADRDKAEDRGDRQHRHPADPPPAGGRLIDLAEPPLSVDPNAGGGSIQAPAELRIRVHHDSSRAATPRRSRSARRPRIRCTRTVPAPIPSTLAAPDASMSA